MSSNFTAHSISQVLQWIENNASRSAIFRGHGDASWKLESRVARFADSRDIEPRVLAEFKRHARPFLSVNEPRSTLEWLALAQHHGVPTRMLDWTTSPLTALWFAAKVNVGAAISDGRLWVFNPDRSVALDAQARELDFDPFEQEQPLLVHPPLVSARITAQNGCFVLQPYSTAERQFVPLDSLNNLVDSIFLPKACFPKLLNELDRCGINEQSLFPGLDSVAKYVTWRATTSF